MESHVQTPKLTKLQQIEQRTDINIDSRFRIPSRISFYSQCELYSKICSKLGRQQKGLKVIREQNQLHIELRVNAIYSGMDIEEESEIERVLWHRRSFVFFGSLLRNKQLFFPPFFFNLLFVSSVRFNSIYLNSGSVVCRF